MQFTYSFTVIVPQLNQQHFPSLPSPSGRPNKASFKSGYTADFRRFTKDDILKIINTVQDVNSRPASVIVAEPGVVEAKPNPTLEISKVPTLPEPEAEEEKEEVTPAPVAAPGVAVREWPSQKSPPPPAPTTATPSSTTTTTTTAASTPATTASSTTTPASPAIKKEALLRKSAEQGDNKNGDNKEATPAVPSSPSISTSSDAIRNPTYADIALGMFSFLYF